MLKFAKISLLVLIMFLISCANSEKNELYKKLLLDAHEHKLLLNNEKFENIQNAFSEYWEIVKVVASEQDLKVVEFENNFKQKNRIVHYYDTKNFDLRKKGFLIRKRTNLIGNELDTTFTYTIKYINEDFNKAAIMDLTLGKGYVPKDTILVAEADIVNGKNADSKPTILYSTSNSTILNYEPGELLSDYTKIFPILATLDIDLSEKLMKVNGVEAKEYNIKPGIIDFGNNLIGEVGMSVREINGYRIPEFSFDHSLEGWQGIPDESKKDCEQFINHLQANAPGWYVEGKLKTAFVYEQVNN